MRPTKFIVRWRVSLDGKAYEEIDGAYILVEEHEAHMNEGRRLLQLAIARYPLSLTEAQMRDAVLWLQ